MNSRQMREMWEQTEGMGDQPMWVVTMDSQGRTYWVYCRRPSTDLQAAVDEAWAMHARGISRADERRALARSHERDVRDVRAYREAQALQTQRMGDADRVAPEPEPGTSGARGRDPDEDLTKIKERVESEDEWEEERPVWPQGPVPPREPHWFPGSDVERLTREEEARRKERLLEILERELARLSCERESRRERRRHDDDEDDDDDDDDSDSHLGAVGGAPRAKQPKKE